ncbi:MAG: c-type cytochrome domain-containing protein, partial [Nannocystaceae bacterium]
MLATLPLVLTLTAPAPAELESKVKAIFDDKCTSCHDDGDDLDLAGPLGRLTAMKGATGAALVTPGDPDASYLVTKLVGGAGMEGELMPMGDDPLPKAELDAIRSWIAALPAAGDGAGASAAPAGRDAATLEAELLALFDDACNACHGEGADVVVLEGSLAHLTTATGATGARMIVPGDVEASYLWTKVKGGAAMEGELMPMGDDPLGDAELALVRDYITALASAPSEGREAGGASFEVGGAGLGADTSPGDDGPAKRDKPPFHGTFQHNLP